MKSPVRKIGDKKRRVVLFFLGIFVGLGIAFLLQTGIIGGLFRLLFDGGRKFGTSRSYKSIDGAKVLCWVPITRGANVSMFVNLVNVTWGRKCDKLVFTKGETDSFKKMKEGFKFVYDKHFRRYDWFLRAEHDSFVIMPNLKDLLKKYDPKRPIWFGSQFQDRLTNNESTFEYMSNWPGYVLSKEALRRFLEVGLGNSTHCSKLHLGKSDVLLGECMQELGVEAGDSRDSSGRITFFPASLEYHLTPHWASDGAKRIMLQKMTYPQTKGYPDCCSNKPIAFHNVTTEQMYIFDYLLLYDYVPKVENATGNSSTSTH